MQGRCKRILGYQRVLVTAGLLWMLWGTASGADAQKRNPHDNATEGVQGEGEGQPDAPVTGDAVPHDTVRGSESAQSRSENADKEAGRAASKGNAEEGGSPVSVRYEDHALRFESRDGNYGAEMQHRLQFRYAWPFDRDPRSLEDINQESHSFMIRRARLKLSGHVFRPWLLWNFQFEWSQLVLRDFAFEINRVPWLRVLVGQRKVFWNDERVSSSGRQQFVNRSIVNDLFTVDRQQGIQLLGRLFPDSFADMSYYVGVFTGRGVGDLFNDDLHMMYAGRLQWNALGGEMAFSQSDIERHREPVLSFAVGGVTNISDCTAFETDDQKSCRALPTPRSDGTSFGDPSEPDEVAEGQFRVDQMVFEARLKWRGLSAKHEFHVKRVRDRTLEVGAPGRQTFLRGSLTQLGYFPHGLISFVPEALELAVRFAHVNPVVGVGGDWQTESSGVINWFFSGHFNKLSLESSWLTVAETGASKQGQIRMRLQWDVSF